jgi:hypothetical protein
MKSALPLLTGQRQAPQDVIARIPQIDRSEPVGMGWDLVVSDLRAFCLTRVVER